MKLQERQRILIKIYQRAAALGDLEYRRLLRSQSGCVSTKDPDWTQQAFDDVIAGLETVLFQRVHAGIVENPIGTNRWIRSEFYWRNKCRGRAFINSRQVHKIKSLWEALLPALDAGQRNTRYFVGIVARATGRNDIGLSRLSSADAWHVIEALTDRLNHAASAVPF